MNVADALKARTSIRAFKPDPVPEALLREILDVARYAPSGGNTQAWKIIAVAGAERDAVVALGKRVTIEKPAGEEGEHLIYPANLWDPFRARRYKVGEDMYKLLGITREDKFARLGQMARNYQFFDAPVGLFFIIEKKMGHGQWAHLGMLMQSIALAAIERGVSSCFQEAWGRVRESLAAHFELPETEMIYCGMALGYADETAPINQLRSDRAPLDEIAVFKGF